MGEFYAEYVLEGKVTYKQAIYIFYLKFPTHADRFFEVMDTIIRVEGREDLIPTDEEIKKVIALAEKNRASRLGKTATNVKPADPVVLDNGLNK